MSSEHVNHQVVHTVKAYLSFHNIKHLGGQKHFASLDES